MVSEGWHPQNGCGRLLGMKKFIPLGSGGKRSPYEGHLEKYVYVYGYVYWCDKCGKHFETFKQRNGTPIAEPAYHTGSATHYCDICNPDVPTPREFSVKFHENISEEEKSLEEESKRSAEKLRYEQHDGLNEREYYAKKEREQAESDARWNFPINVAIVILLLVGLFSCLGSFNDSDGSCSAEYTVDC